jgi:hypothetical protein
MLRTKDTPVPLRENSFSDKNRICTKSVTENNSTLTFLKIFAAAYTTSTCLHIVLNTTKKAELLLPLRTTWRAKESAIDNWIGCDGATGIGKHIVHQHCRREHISPSTQVLIERLRLHKHGCGIQ